MKINLGQREYLLEILNYEYVIPDEFHTCVKDALKKNATNSHYSEEAIDSMLRKPQSMAVSIGAIRDNNLSLFRGKFAEWLACIEYNALKNKGIVLMTIINPDSTSKADLLHIIKKGDKYEAIPGPDIKCGGSSYVFNQWKKIVTNRYDIPMVDMDDVLTTEEGLNMLTEKQRMEFEQLKQSYPKKKPIKSKWNKQDINRLMIDYLKYVSDGITPFDSDDKPFVANKDNRERIKDKIFNLPQKPISQSNWGDFCNRSSELFSIQENYLNPMTIAKLEQKKRDKEIQEKTKLLGETLREDRKKTSENYIEKSNRAHGINNVSKPKQKGIMTNIAKFFGYDRPTEMFAEVAVKAVTALAVEGGRAIAGKMIHSSSGSNQSLSDNKRNARTSNDTNDVKNSTSERSQVDSSIEHIVKKHGQHYNTREGPIWKEKEPYTRGKKNESM
ncbi:hypothetical protein [Paenibacillus alkaliterrae]|uniref:hypothetical protein n=1 Tax=Paenibacillus alkaliterrae TaxID=320909 RepID=UPI0039F080BF